MDGADIKAVVVLSGGQDSATCLALAVRKHGAGHVAAITFRYGQRHALETKFARGLSRHFGIASHKVVSLGFYRQLTTNALMDPAQKIERRKGSACPTTVVEGRNAFFLLAAAVWAKSGPRRYTLGCRRPTTPAIRTAAPRSSAHSNACCALL